MSRSALLLVAGQCILLNVLLASAQSSSVLHLSGTGNLPPPPDTDFATQACGVAPPCSNSSRYRSIDGSCNNLLRPTWGVPQSPYGRLLPFNFADGISTMPVAQSGNDLPNSREISLRLFQDTFLLDPIWNLNTQQWGQITAHDMSLTAGEVQITTNQPICCDGKGQLAPDIENPTCAPIELSVNDPVHSPQGTQCLNFTRVSTTKNRGCTPPDVPAQAITAVSSYMDLSMVYGDNAQLNAQLRSGSGGRLKTVTRNGREWPPQHPNYTLSCISAQSPNEPCYLGGDTRTNQNAQLTILHVTLVLEHNRIADSLATINPHWNDETLYQEARKIHIAENAHINYYEYLPILLGYNNMVKYKLIYPGAQGYVNDYNPNVDPSVLAEHAAAAFRHFHTNIRGFLKLVIENRAHIGTVRMTDWFNRPLILEQHNNFVNLARGLTVQQQDFTDQYWDTEMTQYLFKGNNTFGNDLRAADIQRGRDQGLGSYVATRAACGLSVPSTFEEMILYISLKNILVLKSLYETPEDLDLVVAGSLERNVPGALAGPTFICIMTEQFFRTRIGDRYFYENGNDPVTAFTPSQLQSIRQGSSMARLFCDNVDGIDKMQPKAFEQINLLNRLVPCANLSFVDLTLWKEVPESSE